jgi:hypothetical protein
MDDGAWTMAHGRWRMDDGGWTITAADDRGLPRERRGGVIVWLILAHSIH